VIKKLLVPRSAGTIVDQIRQYCRKVEIEGGYYAIYEPNQYVIQRLKAAGVPYRIVVGNPPRSSHLSPSDMRNLQETAPQDFAMLIRELIYHGGLRRAVDWSKHEEFEEKCVESGGVVQYKTRYAGMRFPDPNHPGRYLVLAICYGGRRGYSPNSMWFNNVPEDVVERLERD